MQIIDTHVHYNNDKFFKNWQDHWQKTQEHDVIKSMIIGFDIDSSQKAIEIAKQSKNLFAVVGLHPAEANKEQNIEDLIKSIKLLIKQNNPIAIGEIGLDYYWLTQNQEKRKLIIAKQKKLFRLQLELANQYNLPVIIHSRDKTMPENHTSGNAYWDILEILQKTKLDKPFVLHCASGPLSYIRESLKIGAYIGVAGNITYKNSNHLKEIIKITPQDKLLSETDAPYLPPQEYRGKTCEPWMIKDTISFLQKELDINPQQMIENAQKFFEIKIVD